MRPRNAACAASRRGAPAAQVSDFGLARDLDVLSKIETKTTGTVTHMAPEVLSRGVVSKAADVFSFGVLLCACLRRCLARSFWFLFAFLLFFFQRSLPETFRRARCRPASAQPVSGSDACLCLALACNLQLCAGVICASERARAQT